MKTGAIIYVTGVSAKKELKQSPRELARRFGIQADCSEVITPTAGHFDIHDAWWRLIAQGMQRVLCLMAVYDDQGELRLARKLRLCG